MIVLNIGIFMVWSMAIFAVGYTIGRRKGKG